MVLVVKELFENVMDVGVMMLCIVLEEGGVKCILIIDDGCGILFDELVFVLMCYVISKICLFEEFEVVVMLGFCGEVFVLIVLVVEMLIMSWMVDVVYVMKIDV